MKCDWWNELGRACRQHSYSIYHSIQKLKVFSFHEHATAILTSNYCYNTFLIPSNKTIQEFFCLLKWKKKTFSFSLEWKQRKNCWFVCCSLYQRNFISLDAAIVGYRFWLHQTQSILLFASFFLYSTRKTNQSLSYRSASLLFINE